MYNKIGDYMKKILYVFLIILMLCGCNNNNTEVKPDRGEKTSIPFSYIDGLQETSYIELYNLDDKLYRTIKDKNIINDIINTLYEGYRYLDSYSTTYEGASYTMKFYNDKDEKINEINLYNTFDTFDILNDNIRYILSHENFNKIVYYIK